MLVSFDPEWSSPSDWARMYRAAGLQVVPARYPMRDRADKRPALAGWREFQNTLAGDGVFEGWFPADAKPNMGVITGPASGNLLVIDIDDYKGGSGAEWFNSVTSGLEPETWQQQTGGGGRQFFFLLPPDVTISSHRTAIGVDIRCQGGFAMLPPSRHMSGTEYAWVEHRAPWDIEIDAAAPSLIEAVQQLIAEHGGGHTSTPTERTASPSTDFDAFGSRVDGREDYMMRLVWGAVVDFYRECPIEPPEQQSTARMREAYALYERGVKSRLSIPGLSKAELLEREGRGHTLFAEKWRNAIRQWNGKVAEAGKEPKLVESPFDQRKAEPADLAAIVAAPRPEGIYEFLDVKGIKTLPDPEWLVDGLVVEKALGFIFGPPGCGKTFVALSMALSISVALGDWWGRSIQRTGAVVYISSEGQADLKFRITAWEQANKVLTDDSPFFLIRQTINFMKPEDIQTLLNTIRAIKQQCDVDIAAVFVDTVSRVLPGADENLQKDMTLFIQGCDLVRQEFGATVIGVHHTSRQGTLRGSTVFDGAGDFLAQIEREEGETLGVLTARKIKAAQDGWKQHFRLDVVACGDISGNSSLVASPAQEAAPEQKQPSTWPDKETCRRILSALEKAWAAGKPWSSYPHARKVGRYAPAILHSDFDIKPKTAEQMIETWLMNGVLSVEIRNSDTKLKGLKLVGRID
jgi:hypothetical protein